MSELIDIADKAQFADGRLGDMAREYLALLLRGDRHAASRLILDGVEAGTPIPDIYLEVFQPCQIEVGRLWQTNQISVAQEHFITAATQLVMSQLYPRIFSTEKNGRRLVATCVGGELHEIGVRMVADMFEMAGWDTYYLGANTPAASLLDAIEQNKADILAVSATITFNVQALAAVIAQVRASRVGHTVRILAGGRPLNIAPGMWRTIGADGYAPDARAAIGVAEKLLS